MAEHQSARATAKRFAIIFVKAYPAETTEAFLDGHATAFGWLGGVPQSGRAA